MLTQDLMLVGGIILCGLAVPAMVGARAEGRPPRFAAIVIMIGGTLILLALSQKPGLYSIAEVPEAFVRVVAYFIR